MFFKHCAKQKLDRTEKFFRLAEKLYNPLNEESLKQQPENNEAGGNENEDKDDDIFCNV